MAAALSRPTDDNLERAAVRRRSQDTLDLLQSVTSAGEWGGGDGGRDELLIVRPQMRAEL